MSSQSHGIGASQDDGFQATDFPAPVWADDAATNERTFPAPWSFDQIPQGYRVLDANHRVLAYVVTGDQTPSEKSGGLTLEEAWRISRVISSLPELITGPRRGRTKRSWFWKSMRGSN